MKRKNKCVGKKTYAYKDIAEATIKKYYLLNGTKLRVYECPACLDFHLTSCSPEPKEYYEAFKPKITTVSRKMRKRRLQKRNLANRKAFVCNTFSNIDYPQFLIFSLKWLR